MASQQTYEQQIEVGRQIVEEALSRLAADICQPQISELKFEETDRDFNHRQVSVIGQRQQKVVLKLNKDDLADASATPAVRNRLETRLRAAVKNYYKI